MKYLILILFTFTAIAGLPPTQTKLNGESTFSTTFKTDYGTLPVTRSGTTVTVGNVPEPMTTAQMNAIVSPAVGRTVYNTDFKAIASYDGTKWVYGFGFLNLDNTYSARVDNAGVVSSENIDWLDGNCSVSGTSLYTCTIKSGVFSLTPNCFVTLDNGTINPFNATMDGLNNTATVLKYSTFNSSTGAANARPVYVSCQKQGTDYLSASSNAYASTNSNYPRTAYTPTFTGFGTVSASSCFHSKDGEFLEIDCKFTSGSPTATEARVSLPSGLTSSSSGELRVAGEYVYDTNSTSHGGIIIIEPSVGYVTFSRPEVYSGSTIGALTKANANNILGSGTVVSLKARVPIQGWSNAPFIVGSFQGYNSTPGVNNPKIFSFNVATGTGAVTNSKGGIVTTCTAANPSVCTLSGLLSTPNCTSTVTDVLGGKIVNLQLTQTSATVYTTQGTTPENRGVTLICHGE